MTVKSFITGATGFIGRRLVDELIKSGHEVICLVRDNNADLPEEAHRVQGDILQTQLLAAAMVGCEYLFHLAGLITFNREESDSLLRVNRDGTRSVLIAAKKAGIKKSVFVSSACTFGVSDSPASVITENTPYRAEWAARNPYLRSKKEAEEIACEMAMEGMDVSIVNPSTIYGPGDYSMNSGTLFRQISGTAMVPVPPGGSNCIDVDDVVKGIIATGEKGLPGRNYILAAENLKYEEIFSCIAKVVKQQPLFFPLPLWTRMPASIAARLYEKFTNRRFFTAQIIEDLFSFKFYSNKRSKQELGWKPEYSFPNCLERAFQFYRDEGLLFPTTKKDK